MICIIALNIHEYREVTTQVKCDIGKTILHNLTINIYNEHVCLCWVFILLGMISCLFSNCNKNSITRLRSLYIMFYLRCKFVTVLDARYSSLCKEAYHWDLLFIGSEERHLWIVSSFKPSQFLNYMKCRHTSDTDVCMYYYHVWLYTNGANYWWCRGSDFEGNAITRWHKRIRRTEIKTHVIFTVCGKIDQSRFI